MNAEMWLCNAASICFSAAVSFLIAKFVRSEARLKIILKPEPQMECKALMVKFWKGREGMAVDKIKIFRLIIKTGFTCGVTYQNTYEKKKPSLFIDGIDIKDVQTLNNNGAKFHIPIGFSRGKSSLILNVNWIRKNTSAEFMIFGVQRESERQTRKESFAKFYPGLLHDVNVTVGGIIDRHFTDNCFVKKDAILHRADSAEA